MKSTHTFYVQYIFFFFRKSCRLWDNIETYFTAGQATDDNMAHAPCILDTQDCKHTLTICNTFCFSTATWLSERSSMLRYTYIDCLAESQLRDLRDVPANTSYLHHIDCLADSQLRDPRGVPANTSYLKHISRTLILNCVSLLFSVLLSRLELYFLSSVCDTVPYPPFIQDSFSFPSTCILVFVVCFSHLYFIFNKFSPFS
jgi:hypothetical protein